jgi:hypothetical protein
MPPLTREEFKQLEEDYINSLDVSLDLSREQFEEGLFKFVDDATRPATEPLLGTGPTAEDAVRDPYVRKAFELLNPQAPPLQPWEKREQDEALFEAVQAQQAGRPSPRILETIPEPLTPGPRLAAGAARVATPVAGGIIGSGVGPWGTYGGAALGGAAGEAIAQHIEMGAGLREEPNLPGVLVGGATAAIPAARLAKLSGPALLAARALEGGALGVGSQTAYSLTEGRLPTQEELLFSGGFGLAGGGLVGGVEAGLKGVAGKIRDREAVARGQQVDPPPPPADPEVITPTPAGASPIPEGFTPVDPGVGATVNGRRPMAWKVEEVHTSGRPKSYRVRMDDGSEMVVPEMGDPVVIPAEEVQATTAAARGLGPKEPGVVDLPQGSYTVAGIAGPAAAMAPIEFSEDPETDALIRQALLLGGVSAAGMAALRPEQWARVSQIARHFVRSGKVKNPFEFAEAVKAEVGPEVMGALTEEFPRSSLARLQDSTQQPAGLFSKLESEVTSLMGPVAKEAPQAFKGRKDVQQFAKTWKADQLLSHLTKRGVLKEAEDRGFADYLRTLGSQVVRKADLQDFLQENQNILTSISREGESLSHYKFVDSEGNPDTLGEFTSPDFDAYREVVFQSPTLEGAPFHEHNFPPSRPDVFLHTRGVRYDPPDPTKPTRPPQEVSLDLDIVQQRLRQIEDDRAVGLERLDGDPDAIFDLNRALDEEAAPFEEALRKLTQTSETPANPTANRIWQVEEVQSTLHQDARKTGYRKPEEARIAAQAAITQKIDALTSHEVGYGIELAAKAGVRPRNAEHAREWFMEAMHNGDPRAVDLYAQKQALIEELRPTTPSANAHLPSPHFPLKDTADWTRLGLKANLLQAAEEGADVMSVTSGEVQARRYGAPKAPVVEVRLDAMLGDLDGATMVMKDVNGVIYNPTRRPGTSIEEYVRDHVPEPYASELLAKKVGREDFPEPRVVLPEPVVMGELGKRRYYDEVIPNSLRKAASTLGTEMTTVGQPFQPEIENPAVRLTPEVQEHLQSFGQPTYGGYEGLQAALERSTREARAAKQDLRADFPGMPFSDELGAARLQLLGPLAGGMAGFLYGAASAEEKEERWTRAAAFAIGGAFVGAAAASMATTPSLREQQIRAMLAQYPRAPERFRGNSLTNRGLSALRENLHIVQKDIGRKFVPYYELKKAGPAFDPAIELFDQFKNRRFAIPHNVVKTIKAIVEPLGDPADYKLFSIITRLRRDLEGHALTGSALEADLDPAVANALLLQAESVAQQGNPAILQAADLHRATVHRIGQVLVQMGKLDPAILAANPEYLRDFVLNKTKPASMTGSKGQPLRPGTMGYLKRRLGGERETLRDYISVMSRYLAEIEQDTSKDLLVVQLAQKYDPRQQPGFQPTLSPSGQMIIPPGMQVFRWPLTGVHGGREFWFPAELAEYLKHAVSPAPPLVQAIRPFHNFMKGTIIKGSMGSYLLMNLLGDSTNVFANVPMLEWHRLPGEARRAFLAKHYLMKDSQALGAQPLKRQMQQAELENIGTASATAEIQEQSLRDPQLRALTQDASRPALAKAATGMVNLASDANAWFDHAREYLEALPRMTLWLHEVEAGRPAQAATVVRRSLVDYQHVTPFEENMLRGFLMPFYTWHKAMAENYLPLLEGTGSLKDRAVRDFTAGLKGKGPFGRLANLLPFALGLAYWNNEVMKEGEHSLEDWEREQAHILVPWGVDEKGRQQLHYFGFAGPAHAAGRLVGMGGAVGRAWDLLKGVTTPKEELEKSLSQIRESWLGQITPLVQTPLSVLSGEDIRTGRNLVSPEMTLKEKALEYAKNTVASLPPVSTYFRAAREGSSPDEDLTKFLKKLVIGSFWKTVDPEERLVRRNMRLFAEGKTEGQLAFKRLRREHMVVPLSEELAKFEPDFALAAYASLGSSRGDMQFRALLQDAAQHLSRQDAKWVEASKLMQLMQQHPAWYEIPAIAEKFSRRAVEKSAFEKNPSFSGLRDTILGKK